MLSGGHIPTQLATISGNAFIAERIDWRQPLRAFIDTLGSRRIFVGQAITTRARAWSSVTGTKGYLSK